MLVKVRNIANCGVPTQISGLNPDSVFHRFRFPLPLPHLVAVSSCRFAGKTHSRHSFSVSVRQRPFHCKLGTGFRDRGAGNLSHLSQWFIRVYPLGRAPKPASGFEPFAAFQCADIRCFLSRESSIHSVKSIGCKIGPRILAVGTANTAGRML